MTSLKFSIISVIILLSVQLAMAQSSGDKPSIEGGTIIQQFDYTINESNRYEQYKVVKETWLKKLKSNVIDTLNKNAVEITANRLKMSEMTIQINTLQDDLNQTNTKLEEAIKFQNSLSFLGLRLQKGTFQNVMWTIIILLIFALISFFYLFKRSNLVTVSTQKELDETKEEYEKHRKEARERHEKTVVEHHNELKKYKDRRMN